MPTLATIGYEATTVPRFLDALRAEGIDLLVDVRAVASSRRPGFAKTSLAANVASVGIEYLHLRGLGTPAEGRAAARAGRHPEMHRIFLDHLDTSVAQDDLARLVELIRSGRSVCILCLEADPARCHRTLVAHAVNDILPVDIHHLRPELDDQV
jgi:uncharacterized protein (DUF488 family)